MLKNRYTATSKQALMADCRSLPSATDKFKRQTSSILSSPRLFTVFASKGFTDTTESVLSPTSTLDCKLISALRNPFCSDSNSPKSPKPENRTLLDKLESRGVGLGIVDALIDEKHDPKLSKPESGMVVFGSQLKIQIPPQPSPVLFPAESLESPGDFGIKTRNSQLGSLSPSFSPSLGKKSPFGSENSGLEIPNLPRVSTGCLSASEMELSEEYTCVISYGPNPRMTHIFDDCIVESCCGGVGFSAANKETGFRANNQPTSYPSESFLSFCYTCKKNLGQGRDIYMYRGEKGFCSNECRYEEMMLEEGMEKMVPN